MAKNVELSCLITSNKPNFVVFHVELKCISWIPLCKYFRSYLHECSKSNMKTKTNKNEMISWLWIIQFYQWHTAINVLFLVHFLHCIKNIITLKVYCSQRGSGKNWRKLMTVVYLIECLYVHIYGRKKKVFKYTANQCVICKWSEMKED